MGPFSGTAGPPRGGSRARSISTRLRFLLLKEIRGRGSASRGDHGHGGLDLFFSFGDLGRGPAFPIRAWAESAESSESSAESEDFREDRRGRGRGADRAGGPGKSSSEEITSPSLSGRDEPGEREPEVGRRASGERPPPSAGGGSSSSHCPSSVSDSGRLLPRPMTRLVERPNSRRTGRRCTGCVCYHVPTGSNRSIGIRFS
ncbi:hypothetical protein TCAL_16208, partial [Tigriopus californicus]